MSDSWDEMKRAKEDAYFDHKNKEALHRLKSKNQTLNSPVTGKPMVQVTHLGINVERCPTSGGVWMDAAELKHLETTLQKLEPPKAGSWIQTFFSLLVGKS
jgi:hypothetical protein